MVLLEDSIGGEAITVMLLFHLPINIFADAGGAMSPSSNGDT
jgi:hypothetical protein